MPRNKNLPNCSSSRPGSGSRSLRRAGVFALVPALGGLLLASCGNPRATESDLLSTTATLAPYYADELSESISRTSLEMTTGTAEAPDVSRFAGKTGKGQLSLLGQSRLQNTECQVVREEGKYADSGKTMFMIKYLWKLGGTHFRQYNTKRFTWDAETRFRVNKIDANRTQYVRTFPGGSKEWGTCNAPGQPTRFRTNLEESLIVGPNYVSFNYTYECGDNKRQSEQQMDCNF